MKNFETFLSNFHLNNYGKRFIFMLISSIVFLILFGIESLCGQETRKYPLGYILNYEEEKAMAYIISPGTGLKSSHVVDSIYIKFINCTYESFPRQNLLRELDDLNSILTKVYLFSNGKEIFSYSDSTEVRNQEKWPQVDKVTSKYYGKMIGNTISLRKETTQEPLRKGWTGPSIALGWMGIFFILLIFFHIWAIKEKEDLEVQYWFILVILLGCMSFPLVLQDSTYDKFGHILYRNIWLSVTLLSILTTIIHSRFLKKYKQKRGLI